MSKIPLSPNQTKSFDNRLDDVEVSMTALQEDSNAFQEEVNNTVTEIKKKAVFTVILDDMYIGDTRVLQSFINRGWIFNSAICPYRYMMKDYTPKNAKLDWYNQLKLLGASFLPHSETHLDMRYNTVAQSVAEYEICESKKDANRLGFEAFGFVAPYSVVHADYLEYIKKTYKYAFNDYMGNITNTINAGKRVYHLPKDDVYKLTRICLSPAVNSIDEIKHVIDLAVENGGLDCFYDHSVGGDTGTEISVENLNIVLDYIQDYVLAGKCEVLPTDQAVSKYFGIGLANNNIIQHSKENLVSNFEITTSAYTDFGKWQNGANSTLTAKTGETARDTYFEVSIPTLSVGDETSLTTVIDLASFNLRDVSQSFLRFLLNTQILSAHTSDDIELDFEFRHASDYNSSAEYTTDVDHYYKTPRVLSTKKIRQELIINALAETISKNAVATKLIIRFKAKTTITNVLIRIDTPILTCGTGEKKAIKFDRNIDTNMTATLGTTSGAFNPVTVSSSGDYTFDSTGKYLTFANGGTFHINLAFSLKSSGTTTGTASVIGTCSVNTNDTSGTRKYAVANLTGADNVSLINFNWIRNIKAGEKVYVNSYFQTMSGITYSILGSAYLNISKVNSQ